MKIKSWIITCILFKTLLVFALEAKSDWSQTQLTKNVGLSGHVDVLYLKFLRSDIEFLIDDDEGNLVAEHLTHDWSFGYRVGGRINYNQLGFGIRYTNFEDSQSKNVRNFQAHHKIDYNLLNVYMDYSCYLSTKWLLSSLIGMKVCWVDTKYDKLQSLDTSSGTLNCFALGPYLGLESLWKLCHWRNFSTDFDLAVVSRLTIGNLYGKFKIKIDENTTPFRILTDEYLYVPVYELYIAWDFTICQQYTGLKTFFQLGYEIQFWNGWRQWFDADALADFGLGGLVVKLGLNF